jgi:DNA-binding HxlR family transcriptional regulator
VSTESNSFELILSTPINERADHADMSLRNKLNACDSGRAAWRFYHATITYGSMLGSSYCEFLSVRRKSLEKDVCATARALDVIGDWWSLLIIRDALGGFRRFSDFQRHLGAAKNILAARLKALVQQGIFEIAPASDGSAYKEYLLTKKGRALLPAIVALAQWGNEYLFDEHEPCSVPVDRARGKPLRKLKLVARDGRELALTEIGMTPDN